MVSKYDKVTVTCTVCGVRISGRRDRRTGVVYTARNGSVGAVEVKGQCAFHAYLIEETPRG